MRKGMVLQWDFSFILDCDSIFSNFSVFSHSILDPDFPPVNYTQHLKVGSPLLMYFLPIV